MVVTRCSKGSHSHVLTLNSKLLILMDYVGWIWIRHCMSLLDIDWMLDFLSTAFNWTTVGVYILKCHLKVCGYLNFRRHIRAL